jgi:hypothetical protein
MPDEIEMKESSPSAPDLQDLLQRVESCRQTGEKAEAEIKALLKKAEALMRVVSAQESEAVNLAAEVAEKGRAALASESGAEERAAISAAVARAESVAAQLSSLQPEQAVGQIRKNLDHAHKGFGRTGLLSLLLAGTLVLGIATGAVRGNRAFIPLFRDVTGHPAASSLTIAPQALDSALAGILKASRSFMEAPSPVTLVQEQPDGTRKTVEETAFTRTRELRAVEELVSLTVLDEGLFREVLARHGLATAGPESFRTFMNAYGDKSYNRTHEADGVMALDLEICQSVHSRYAAQGSLNEWWNGYERSAVILARYCRDNLDTLSPAVLDALAGHLARRLNDARLQLRMAQSTPDLLQETLDDAETVFSRCEKPHSVNLATDASFLLLNRPNRQADLAGEENDLGRS